MIRRLFLLSGAATALGAGAARARVPFVRHAAPERVLSPPILDGRGRTLTLADFAGRVVLVNVWATWCPPCRTEMPALDALQARLGGPGFTVLPVSVDAGGIEAARRFYWDTGISSLDLYWADDLRVGLALGVLGLPTSLLIDRRGRELGRVSGPVQWEGDDTLAQIAAVVEGGRE